MVELPDEDNIQSFLTSGACVDHLKLNLQSTCENTRKNTLSLLIHLVENHAKEDVKGQNLVFRIGQDFFEFVTEVVSEVSIIELTRHEPRLGPFKLRLLDFLKKISESFGTEIRTYFKNGDLYTILLELYD